MTLVEKGVELVVSTKYLHGEFITIHNVIFLEKSGGLYFDPQLETAPSCDFESIVSGTYYIKFNELSYQKVSKRLRFYVCVKKILKLCDLLLNNSCKNTSFSGLDLGMFYVFLWQVFNQKC